MSPMCLLVISKAHIYSFFVSVRRRNLRRLRCLEAPCLRACKSPHSSIFMLVLSSNRRSGLFVLSRNFVSKFLLTAKYRYFRPVEVNQLWQTLNKSAYLPERNAKQNLHRLPGLNDHITFVGVQTFVRGHQNEGLVHARF